MDKETLIAKARALESLDDLFNLLNEIKEDLVGDKAYPFTRKQFISLSKPQNVHRYLLFSIPKKSGGERPICAPYGNLKWFQICLNEIFKALYTPSPYAMGFTEGRSIVDNARMHTNQNYVFNIDLKDFFPSIKIQQVRKRLQLAPFNFNTNIAWKIAGFCTISSWLIDKESTPHFVLPQGAPTSPLLTNAVCDKLDRRLHGLAKRFGLHYSRYADDITFSSMHNVYQPDSEFRRELQRIITDQGFTINEKKTRLSHCSKRQEVTGLTVGAKINVTRKYVKDLRAILHIWEKYGLDAAYAAFYPRYKSEKCKLRYDKPEPDLVNVIAGKLCYLKMVKGENDPIYTKLHAQYLRLTEEPKATENCGKIHYIFTMSKAEFEKKLGVSITFDNRKQDNKPYGFFDFQDKRFIVAVSKNLDVNKLPDDVQISLTRTRKPYARITSSNEISKAMRIGYILHKPLHGFRPAEKQPTDNIAAEIQPAAIGLVNTHPELGLTDNLEINQSHNQETLLRRLVESDFDLSILP